MQYILSEQEYQDLRKKQSMELKLEKDKLQKLCTKIANEMPVYVAWRDSKPPQPWGCALENGGYCDECPVTTICPSPKKWSK